MVNNSTLVKDKERKNRIRETFGNASIVGWVFTIIIICALVAILFNINIIDSFFILI